MPAKACRNALSRNVLVRPVIGPREPRMARNWPLLRPFTRWPS